MVTIRRILLPTDFSELAVHAAPFARSLATVCQAALHVVHVCEPVATAVPSPETGGAVLMPPPDEGELKSMLDTFVREHLGSPAVPVYTAVLRGGRAAEITRYAKVADVDVIVIGTHARGVMNRIIFGSVSKSVLEHAHCAVLMVPLAAAPQVEPEPVVDRPGELLARDPGNGAH